MNMNNWNEDDTMSKINAIQTAIKELDGGSFQKLFDAYLYSKYDFDNIQTLGVQEGTNKTTKGTPDTFVKQGDKYILIMYGSVQNNAFTKLKGDILSCFDKSKLDIPKDKIIKIICVHSSSNIHIEHIEELNQLIKDVEIEVIGLDTISHDLLYKYPGLAADHLNIPIDTEQIFSIREFVKRYDRNGINAPLNIDLIGREEECKKIEESVLNNKITLVTGASGIGKTRALIEVGRKCEESGWKFFCIRDNGQPIAQDLKYYISDPGKYLLFIDDANEAIANIDYLLTFATESIEGIEINIIMSIRDYAKQKVREVVCKFFRPNEIEIGVLSNDDITTVLKESFSIKNQEYINRILEVSKGNIRLAILATQLVLEKGLYELADATEIFSNYYGHILRNADINELEIKSMFVVSLFGTVNIKECDIIKPVLRKLDIEEHNFVDSCKKLSRIELIDLYQNEVIKISDQSLANYVCKSVLLEKKHISIADLLEIGFIEFKGRIIFTLNTLMNLFYSKNAESYIETEVNTAWNKTSGKEEWEYLLSFYSINPEKALKLIKDRIGEENPVEQRLEHFDFEKNKNFNSIKSDIIKVLCGFKYSKYFEVSVKLLLEYFAKRPDLVMEFYFCFSDRISYDLESYKFSYEKELLILKLIWESSEEGRNTNTSLLFLHIIDSYLNGNVQTTKESIDSRGINIINYDIVFSEGIKELRNFIWQKLSLLYNYKQYKKKIHHILSENYFNRMSNENALALYEYDIKCIENYFFYERDSLTFEECKVLYELYSNGEWLNANEKEFLGRRYESREFSMYEVLLKKHKKGRSYDEDIKEHKKEIDQLIDNFTDDDYHLLFKICQDQAGKTNKGFYGIEDGLLYVFESVAKKSNELLLEIIDIYLEYGAPFNVHMYRNVEFILQQYGIEGCIEYIEKKDFSYKLHWLTEMWEIIPEEELNDKYMKKFNDYIHKQKECDNCCFPHIEHLIRYKKYNKEIVGTIGEIVLEKSKEYPHIAATFLERGRNESLLINIMELFDDDLALLEKIYLNAIGYAIFDYEGDLLFKLMKVNPSFWASFTNELAQLIEKSHRVSYESRIFNRAWSSENYINLIDIARDNLLGRNKYFYNTELELIFANTQETSDLIRERKRNWFFKKIEESIDSVEELKAIFSYITLVYKNERLDFYLRLVNDNKDIEVFKQIPLFSSFQSWSGSEIPLIDRKIDFITTLIEKMEGLEYIDHRYYLKEIKDSIVKNRQRVMIREYVENGTWH